jgi:hypothetical protein
VPGFAETFAHPWVPPGNEQLLGLQLKEKPVNGGVTVILSVSISIFAIGTLKPPKTVSVGTLKEITVS